MRCAAWVQRNRATIIYTVRHHGVPSADPVCRVRMRRPTRPAPQDVTGPNLLSVVLGPAARARRQLPPPELERFAQEAGQGGAALLDLIPPPPQRVKKPCRVFRDNQHHVCLGPGNRVVHTIFSLCASVPMGRPRPPASRMFGQ